ncbi:LysR family transcriptional regulator [Mesorhizobium sp. LjNodule214]|uniref:LysR family transcriptional regulator n=1 Tax=Mesorhizobium sp. LjNodule214 TaxID=3342252 RepID=UPI003ECD19E8
MQAAGAGSFAKAAQQLGLTRSAVGKAVARLEERLKTRLFHRTTRGQSLTDSGQAFYERCLVIMADIESAEAALDQAGSSPSGVLRVSAPVLLGRHCVAPILIALSQRHARLEVDLRFSDQFVDLVEDRIDVAVRIGPLPDRAGQIARKLGGFDMIACAAPSYLAKRGCPVTPEDLSRHDCLPFYRRGGRPEPWRFMAPDGSTTELATEWRIRFDDLDSIVDAAVDGIGITCQPSWLVKGRIGEGSLRPILTEYRAIGNDVFAVRQQAQHIFTKVRAAVDALADQMPRLLSR